MTAVAIMAPGGPEMLRTVTRPVPRPRVGEVLVRVAAAGVNRPDLLQRQGHYAVPPDASDLPGLEIAGEVVALGEGVRRWRVGDKVCALTHGGGYAQFCAVDERHALPVPEGLSLREAGAMPETVFTVWTNVFDRGRLVAGETLLVHGGSSGIGTTAIQLARAFGARVFTTVGNDAKAAACLALGAERAIRYREEDFVAVLKAAGGADVILDMVGGAYVDRNYQAAAENGRIVQIAFLEGAKVTVDLSRLMQKRLVHTGSTLRPRTGAEKAAIARALEDKVWPLVAAGGLRPPIDAHFPLERAADAHRRLEAGDHVGKIVLDVVS